MIVLAASIIAVAIAWSIPYTYDYHEELKSIAYQLSRIADALNKKGGGVGNEVYSGQSDQD